MQNNVFSKINVSTRLLILIMISLSIIIAKSPYLIMFLTIFFFLIFLLTNKSVKLYIYLIKSVKFWLLFMFIAYIIIFRNVLYSFVVVYKMVLIILFVRQFSLTSTFSAITNAVKTLIKPLNRIFNIDKMSYNIVVFIYFLSTYINSKNEIFKNYDKEERLIYSISLKHNGLPRFLYSISKINQLESTLKLKFYRPVFEKKSKISNITLLGTIFFFIIIIFKEVII